MRVSIFGLGYVGVVTAACLARDGHDVWGVDVNEHKVAMLERGLCPIIEPGLDALMGEVQAQGRLRATTDPMEAVERTDVSLVCVGTPSRSNGSLDLGSMGVVIRQIGEALRDKQRRHCVVVRSTVLPGATRDFVIPTLETSSKKRPNKDFDVCFNPEFLREGTSLADFYTPPFTIVGAETRTGADVVVDLYKNVEGPREQTTYEVAEMLKYVCNSFHALKVSFANEVGVLCKSMGIDSHIVMDLFLRDKKLNISPAYLKPGFAFGGSCLPKDLRALMYRAKENDLRLPLLASAMESNALHIQRVVDQIVQLKKKRVGFLGLSFKKGTDDLRESPIVPVIEAVIGKGFNVMIHDADVHMASLVGANKQYIEQEIPHISSLMSPMMKNVIDGSEVIVVAKLDKAYKDALAPHVGQKVILDLVRLPFEWSGQPQYYDGICW